MNNQTKISKKNYEKDEGRHIVDVLFVLALFGIFAASALMLVTLGTNVYKQTVSHMDGNYTERTAYAYITEKIRQNNSDGAISIAELEGTPALVFTTSLADVEYCTYLYYYEGHLKELSLRKDIFAGSSLLSAGQDIIPLSSFSIEPTENNLIKLRICTEDNNSFMIYASLNNNS